MSKIIYCDVCKKQITVQRPEANGLLVNANPTGAKLLFTVVVSDPGSDLCVQCAANALNAEYTGQ